MKVELVVGLRDSGKSCFAEERALKVALPAKPLYVATLPPIIRFSERIRVHHRRRGNRWEMIELSDSFEEILVASSSLARPRVVLLDGLGVFLARSLLASSSLDLDVDGRISSIEVSYKQFLAAASSVIDLFIVVSTMVSGSVLKGIPNIEKLGINLNANLCAHTASIAGVVWHANEGSIGAKRWHEIAEYYGLTMF